MSEYVDMAGTTAGGTGAGTAWSGEQPLITPEPWMRWASCPDTDPDAFFPEKGGSVKEAKTICGTCAVQAECLQFALDNGEQFGIYGGLTAKERRGLRRAAA